MKVRLKVRTQLPQEGNLDRYQGLLSTDQCDDVAFKKASGIARWSVPGKPAHGGPWRNGAVRERRRTFGF